MLHVLIASAGDEIRPGSTGRPVPGYYAQVIGYDGNPVPDGQPGRLAVRGPTGCRYLSDPRQQDYVEEGWNVTGDIYVKDADGYYWFQARSDDMIISGGYNIAGPEVEEALLGHPDVAEVAVVRAPDAERGMVVAAFVVLRDGAHGDRAKVAELQDFAKKTIAPYKYPRVIEFVPQLPKTISGKTQFRSAGHLRGSGPAVVRDQVQDLVSGALVGCCMTKAISAQNGLAAPGPGTRGLKCGQPASRRPYACAGPGSPGVIRLSR